MANANGNPAFFQGDVSNVVINVPFYSVQTTFNFIYFFFLTFILTSRFLIFEALVFAYLFTYVDVAVLDSLIL